MSLNLKQNLRQIKPGNINDPKEWERILMQYQGVFRNQIPKYIKTVIHKKKAQKNLSR